MKVSVVDITVDVTDCTILSPRNNQVHEINATILDSVVHQEKITYLNIDIRKLASFLRL